MAPRSSHYDEIASMLRRMPRGWVREYRKGRDQLANAGGPVLPDVPSPEQAMQLVGITAGGNLSGDVPYGPHEVPKAVRDAALKGLRLSYQHGYGAWAFIGLARAIELVLSPGVSERTVKRMRDYLRRHAVDKGAPGFGDDRKPSRGYMAWLNWGGDPAVNWTRIFQPNPLRNPRRRTPVAEDGSYMEGVERRQRRKGKGERAFDTAQTAGSLAVAGAKLGGRAIPVVGEVLMVAGAGKEAVKVARRRLKKGLTSGSVAEDIARIGAGAFGLESFVPEAKKNPRRQNPVALSPGPFGGTDFRTTSGDGHANVFVGTGKQTAQLLKAAYPKYPDAIKRVGKHKGKVAWLDYMEARETGKGAGSRVLAETLAALDAQGLEAVYLHAASGEEQDARVRFFSRHGFVSLPDDADRPRRLMVRLAPRSNPRRRNPAPPNSALFQADFKGGDMDAVVEGLAGVKYADLGPNGKAWADPQRAMVLATVNRIREAVAKVDKTTPKINNEAVKDIVSARANMLVAFHMPSLFFEKFGIRRTEPYPGPDVYVMKTPAAAATMEVLTAQGNRALSAWWSFSEALDRFNRGRNTSSKLERAIDSRLEKYDPSRNIDRLRSNEEIRAALPAVTAAVLEDKELRADVIRTLLNLKKFAGAPLPPGATPCPKCGGTGFIPAYISVQGGECFACEGTGVKPPDDLHDNPRRRNPRRRNPRRRNPARIRRNPRDPQTETAAFRRWFGASKVVDERGEPLVVYHGSKMPGHDVFRPRSIKKAGTGEALSGKGIYFTTERDFADRYAGETGGIYSVYLKITRPFVRGKSIWGDEAIDVALRYITDAVSARYAESKIGALRRGQFLEDVLPPDTVTEMLLADGYDGVVDGHIYVALDPTQIKSATENVGTFDPSDPSILRNPRRNPDPTVEVYRDRRGDVSSVKVRLAGGELSATRPDPAEQEMYVSWSSLPESERGKGQGIRMYTALMDWALENDFILTSDETVSREAGRVWEALARRGYPIRKHPESRIGPGGSWYAHGREPPFLLYRPNPRRAATTAERTDPALWEAVKREVTAGSKGGRPGQWSARKAQLAVALYKQRGGDYWGPKSPRNALVKWTREDWRTRSGRPSLETGERYLPARAIEALSPQEYAATTRAKREGMRRGEQFVAQPERIARKTSRYRKNPRRC